jgi:predicted protein tyrosine phosphatase
MASKKDEDTLSRDIEEGFEHWKKVLTDLAKAANDSYMPLVSESLKLTKKLIEVYERAFEHALKK